MSQNLQNFVKFQKFQLENLLDFEKCCKTHFFFAKFGLDTAENEPARSLQNLENDSRKIQMFNVANNTNLLTLQL